MTAASGLFESARAETRPGSTSRAPAYLNAVVLVRQRARARRTARRPARHRGQARPGAERGLGRSHPRPRHRRRSTRCTKQTETITLPHPRAWDGPSCLAPWLQVEPDAVLAGRGRVADLLAATTDTARAAEAPPFAASVRDEAHAGVDAPAPHRARRGQRRAGGDRAWRWAADRSCCRPITLPIALSAIGAIIIVLALPDPPRDQGHPARTGRPVLRDPGGDARQGQFASAARCSLGVGIGVTSYLLTRSTTPAAGSLSLARLDASSVRPCCWLPG